MDTTYIKKARTALDKSEETVRSLISDAAMAQEYGAVTRLAELARSLAVLAAQLPSSSDGLQDSMRKADRPSPQDSSQAKRQPSTIQKAITKKVTGSKTKKGEYPKFKIEPDRLTKTGWSKKGRTEYQHRAPVNAVRNVFRNLQNISVEKQIFTVDDVLPVTGEDNQEVPSYQVYMTVAWLVDCGVLTKHGRDGYQLSSDVTTTTLDAIWQW